MGGMASAAADDVKIGLGRMEPTEGFRQRTAARKRFEADQAASYGGDNNPSPRQPAPARAAPAVNYNIAPVAAAPTVPDPDAIGETEQALLDAHKAAGIDPLYPYVVEMPVGIDKSLEKHFESGDEYIYWPN